MTPGRWLPDARVIQAPRCARRWALLGALPLLGCSGKQSALDPAGEHAQSQAALFWWMTGGVALVWLVVIGIALYAAWTPARTDLTGPRRLIVWGGVIVPTAVLTLLLVYGLSMLEPMLAPAAPSSLRVAVTGEQFWWRVRYLPPGASPVDLANEIRLPVGEEVEFLLDARDVIHSFWIPALGGKMDMIPGRQTRLRLVPTRVGEYRGVCAEYCGSSHAFMSFGVIVQERADFARWLAAQREPAPAPATQLAERGRGLLLSNGCGACHTLRGTSADGRLGPDLTHVGGRLGLGAGLLPTRAVDFERWLSETTRQKPGVHMPSFGMLPPEDVRALAAYLEGLE
jgi:cytochrome c oxidase subunit 2